MRHCTDNYANVKCLLFFCLLSFSVMSAACSNTVAPAVQTNTLIEDQRAYNMNTLETVKSSWKSPRELTQNERLITLVTLKINKDGSIRKIVIDQSSRNAEFDEAALNAIRAVKRFPPIPESSNAETIEVSIRFVNQ